MELIVANGTVVTATDTFQADVGIAGGRIVALGERLEPGPATHMLDATGRLVIPGGVDTHTHLDSPNAAGGAAADDFVTGTIAAACGGTTTIVDFCGQRRGGSLAEALADYHRRAEGKAVIDYSFHIIVVDGRPEVLDELLTMPAQGVTSIKLFLAYKGRNMVDDATVVAVLDRARQSDQLVLVHAEHGEVIHYLQQRLLAEGKTAPKYHATSRPPLTEAEATARSIALAELVGARLYIVHVSGAVPLDEVQRGRARGYPVLAETCPQYLFTTEADLDRPDFEGAKYVFTPPPRTAADQAALWHALETGALQAVASDHSAHYFATQKAIGRDDFTRIPNGAPGIEERVTLVYQGVVQGKLSLNRWVAVTATNPARMFDLPTKGTIAVGADADLVLWHPDLEWTITQSALHHRVDYTCYEGLRVRGAPDTVLRRGEILVRHRQFVGGPGGGRYLQRTRLAGTGG